MAQRRDSKNRILNSGEYQKQDGRYMYRYIDIDGTTRFVYSWTLTQTDKTPNGKKKGKCLRELEKEILKDLNDGISNHSIKDKTLNEIFYSYMENKIELRDSTKVLYLQLYNFHISNTIGKMRLIDITYSHIKNFYKDLLINKNYKIGTVEFIQKFLSPVFEEAVRNRYIRNNPLSGIIKEVRMLDRSPSLIRHCLTIEEQKSFLQFVKNDKRQKHYFPLYVFLLGTGCRIGEALGLTWDNCDFKNDIIYIKYTLKYSKTTIDSPVKFIMSAPKTTASVRIIPMLPQVKEVLLDVKKNLNIASPTVDNITGFVFLSSKGTLLNDNMVNKHIATSIKNHNKKEILVAKKENRQPVLLPKFTAHYLRHTFCTRFCENETNLKVIQAIMGHSNIKTTMNIYADVTEKKKLESFNTLKDKFKIY